MDLRRRQQAVALRRHRAVRHSQPDGELVLVKAHHHHLHLDVRGAPALKRQPPLHQHHLRRRRKRTPLISSGYQHPSTPRSPLHTSSSSCKSMLPEQYARVPRRHPTPLASPTMASLLPHLLHPLRVCQPRLPALHLDRRRLLVAAVHCAGNIDQKMTSTTMMSHPPRHKHPTALVSPP